MKRTLSLALLTLNLASTASGQLPFLTAPGGTLRIELGGHFLPTDEEFADGTRRRLGSPIQAADALGAGVTGRLAEILGRPAAPISLGTISANVAHQRSEGILGLAVGVTSRLTVSARLPIVSTRTESRLEFEADGSNYGVNPAIEGNVASEQWLAQFGAALATLRERRDAGEYNDDPTRLALANQVLASAPQWHTSVTDLLVGDQRALVLPLASSADGTGLLDQATTFRDQLSQELGVAAPGGTPALPTEAMSQAAFNGLRENPDGLGWGPVEEQPITSLGDVELRATWALFSRSNPERNSWLGAWVSGGATLPTGTPPRADRLRDIGSGDGQLDIIASGVVETGRGRFGIRAEAEYRVQQPGERTARVGLRDQYILPASAEAVLEWNPGEVLSVTARPFFRIADRLALTGSLTWWSRSADEWKPLADFSGDPVAVSQMGEGTKASALIWGAGIGYIHDGSHVDGVRRMPVEAGLAIERVASSGSGLVAAPLTTRVWFRVYKKLW